MNINFDFIKNAENLLKNSWQFAKTMQDNPHWYTLRKNWKVDQEFIDAVMFIRENGYKEKYGKYYYTILDINGMKYWTMGAPIWYKNGEPCTILINRAWISKDNKSKYADIASQYDNLFSDEDSIQENIEVFKMINQTGFKTVLDIGCGTGLFLDYSDIKPKDYIGIDPSKEMLFCLNNKHPEYLDRVLETSFDCYIGHDEVMQKSDLAVSLFGSANYIKPEKLKDIEMFTNKQFLIFFGEKYHPVTYDKTGIELCHFNINEYDLTGYKLTDFNNFVVATK